ncbi:MAG: hypothetical protein OXG39_00220 [Chloroflexi bacterium]|nr:hypothetical protein [Chloroflexota bacterium]
MKLINAKRLQALSVIFGLFVSGYLSYLKIAAAPSVCVKGGPFNCDLVLNSKYSELGGIPIAWLGFAIYLILALILLIEDRHELLRLYGGLAAFGVALFAWLFSMWLVYVQFVLLAALCPWCLSHEINFTILFGLICLRLYRGLSVEQASAPN